MVVANHVLLPDRLMAPAPPVVDPMGINQSQVNSLLKPSVFDCLDCLILLSTGIAFQTCVATFTADCMEKIHFLECPEFHDRKGSVLVFKMALYKVAFIMPYFLSSCCLLSTLVGIYITTGISGYVK